MKLLMLSIFLIAGLSGCVSVPTANKTATNEAKQFAAPPAGKAGIYVYRKNRFVGGALKKDVYIDDKCIGETAPGVFFYQEVEGDTDHKIGTESEFSPNNISIYTKSKTNYFIEQAIKIGVFVGGASLTPSIPDDGANDISPLKMAVKGKCSNI